MFYPGDILDFVLENGTHVSTQWVAIYNYQDSTGPLQTGSDFYNFFVLGVCKILFLGYGCLRKALLLSLYFALIL
jgi:hypothetical protein